MSLESIKEAFVGKRDIWDVEFKPPVIDRNLTMHFGSKHRGSIRLSMGLFYTGEEWDTIRERVLETPLP
jgi:hypothetical protein